MSMTTKEQHDLLVHALTLLSSAVKAHANPFEDSLEVIKYLAKKYHNERLFGLVTLATQSLGNEDWVACHDAAIEIFCEYVEIRTEYIVYLARQI